MTNLLAKTSRMRMFAGPNGSGKSTMKSVIKFKLPGYCINLDEIESEISRGGFLDFDRFGTKTAERCFALAAIKIVERATIFAAFFKRKVKVGV